MSELLNVNLTKKPGSACFFLYNNFEICIPLEDWVFLCKKRWFTNNPERDVVEAEFGLYNARHAQNSEEALDCVKNCINDLKSIMGANTSQQCNKLLNSNITTLLTIDDKGMLVVKNE